VFLTVPTLVPLRRRVVGHPGSRIIVGLAMWQSHGRGLLVVTCSMRIFRIQLAVFPTSERRPLRGRGGSMGYFARKATYSICPLN